MKKLFFLVSLLVLIGVSGSVFAANVGLAIAPAIGDIFKYKVNGTTGNSYSWYVTNSPNITVGTSAGVELADADKNEVTITWKSPIIGTVYFVHVTENSGSCSNHKVIAVVPKNAFTLAFVNTSAAGDDQPVNAVYEVCPADINNTITYNGNAAANSPATNLTEATNFTYNYQTTYLYYHITAAGIATSTTGYKVTITPTLLAAIAKDRSATISADFGTISGGTFTGAGNIPSVTTTTPFSHTVTAGTNAADLWLRISIANGSEYEGLTANDITLSLTGEDQYGNIVTKVNGVAGSDTEGTKVKERPDSGSIQTN